MQRAWNVRLKTKRVSSSKIVSAKGLTLALGEERRSQGSEEKTYKPQQRMTFQQRCGRQARVRVVNKPCIRGSSQGPTNQIPGVAHAY